MKGESLAPSKLVFMVERSMISDGYEPYKASVEVLENRMSFVLDDSEYCFTAQQCAEVAKNLARVLVTYSGLGIFQGRAESIPQLEAYTCWYQLIEARTSSTRRDSLQTYESENKGYEFCASGSFRCPESHHGETVYYELAIALDDELSCPSLSIDGRTFPFTFDEAFWLVEQLWIAGYLVAQTEQQINSTTKVPRINGEGQLVFM
jgi:hypothetical protein